MTLPKPSLDGRPARVPLARRFPPHIVAWSEQEDAVLRAHYPHGGSPACQVLLTNRSKVAIQRRAVRLGIPSGFVPPSPIPGEERALLEAVVRGKHKATVTQLAQRLKITKKAVRRHMRKIRERLQIPPRATVLGAPASAPARATRTARLPRPAQEISP